EANVQLDLAVGAYPNIAEHGAFGAPYRASLLIENEIGHAAPIAHVEAALLLVILRVDVSERCPTCRFAEIGTTPTGRVIHLTHQRLVGPNVGDVLDEGSLTIEDTLGHPAAARVIVHLD